MCGGSHIRPPETPTREQRTILQKQNAIVDQSVIKQQVRQTNSISAMFCNLQSAPQKKQPDETNYLHRGFVVVGEAQILLFAG